MNECELIQKELFALQDITYGDFHSKLMPNIERERIIGVRIPMLRKLTKKIYKEGCFEGFLKQLPHLYYEENNVHGALISLMKDYDRVIDELNRFLPYVDNWATCDLIANKCFEKNLDRFLEQIKRWLLSEDVYTVRFAINALNSYYLGDAFDPSQLYLVASIKSDEYYINMAAAWYFATALAKQYDEAVKLIEDKALSLWVHNKTIQKAVESYRITDEQKDYLRALKIK